MTDSWLPTNKIVEGDAVETLAKFPDSSIHMAMCSPPYYGLRDYGEDGQIGLEDSLDEYIDRLVDVGKELQRVLRDDGSWWLNLGDSYCTRRRARKSGGEQDIAKAESERTNEDYSPDGDGSGRYHNASLMEHSAGFVDKDKMLVPHRTAIALQADGWVVRNDAVWAKPNPMPESVTDRLSTTFEFVFHLTPTPDYWYDLDAIREPHAESTKYRNQFQMAEQDELAHGTNWDNNRSGFATTTVGKNPGDIFEVTTKPFPDAHFAVYPPELCEKPIKATVPEQVCAECGTPHQKRVEEIRKKAPDNGKYWDPQSQQFRSVSALKRQQKTKADRAGPDTSEDTGLNSTFVIGRKNKGYRQTCDCGDEGVESGIVLDPFVGAGTTCLVAKRLGRRFIGIDINAEYVAMAQSRIGITVDNPHHLVDDQQSILTEITSSD